MYLKNRGSPLQLMYNHRIDLIDEAKQPSPPLLLLYVPAQVG